MRILTLHQIQIKNVDEWDEKKATDFVGSNPQAQSSGTFKAPTSENHMTINEEVKCTEYAPAIFQAIREMDGITDEMIQQSLDVQFNRTQVFKAKESAGKSGSFFFFSHDRKFLLKTMNDREMKVFERIMPTYFEHFRQNPNSLLARIYGIFTVCMEDIVPVHILLMANSAQCGKLIEYVFDLKGSEINREVPDKEITKGGTLKDQNLLKICKEENILIW